MQRRTFLRTAAGAGLGALAASRASSAADAEVVLTPGTPGPVISPHIYGHFIEHLGGVIYDGIWVGRDSKIPNIDGIRKQFVEDMKAHRRTEPPLAGGLLRRRVPLARRHRPRDKRPRTYNFWEPRMPEGVRATEANRSAPTSSCSLCRLVGAEPYVAANVGSGTPREFHDWVLYCNAPTGTVSLADERAANGAREPFGVRYWGVGNESWGCGGDMTGGEYATLYRKFVTQLPEYTRAVPGRRRPPGPLRRRGPGLDQGLLRRHAGRPPLTRGRLRPALLHGLPADPRGRRPIRRRRAGMPSFKKASASKASSKTTGVVMGQYDPEHHTRFVIDEWGNWYRGGTELGPAYLLSQTITLRDALHAAMTFDVFNRHAEKIEMANVAQTINCLHSLFAAVEDKYTRTPAYYAFEMYRPHMGSRLVPMHIGIPELTVPLLEGSAKLAGLSGSASIRDRRLAVTLTNPSLDAAVSALIRVGGGGRVAEGRGTVLTHEEMTATNTFDDPDNVTLKDLTVKVRGDAAQVTVPRHAVVALELQIA